MNRSNNRKSNVPEKQISLSQGRCSVIFRPLILVLLTLFISGSLIAREHDDVLILNSDVSISKYSLANTEFKSKVTRLQGEIDLGSKWLDERNIENKILELDPDIIYCIGSKAYQMARKAGKDKNIIFSLIINWQRLPMGKNTYGISNELPQSMQLTMYRYFFPDIRKIGVLYSKEYNKEWFDRAVESAEEMDIDIIGRSVSKPSAIKSALKKLLPKVDALWLIPDPIVIRDMSSVNMIFDKSEAAGKPILAYDKAFSNLGASFVMSADISTIGKQAAVILNDIQTGQEIFNKIQDPAGTYIILNMKKVKEYGINLNVDALDSVNEIIE
jgi:putative ABC transport system substrate-binding protein